MSEIWKVNVNYVYYIHFPAPLRCTNTHCRTYRNAYLPTLESVVWRREGVFQFQCNISLKLDADLMQTGNENDNVAT